MPGKRILSDEQLDEMVALREAGKTCQWIANHFTRGGTRVGASTIDWHCLRLGVTSPRGLRQLDPANRRPMRRGAHTVRPYTPEEDGLLLAFDRQGLSRAEMALRLDRRVNSICGRLFTLARRETAIEDHRA